jgi:hypothetical protein
MPPLVDKLEMVMNEVLDKVREELKTASVA